MKRAMMGWGCLAWGLALLGALGGQPAMAQEGVDYSLEESWAYYGLGEEKEVDLFLVAPTVDMKEEYSMSLSDEELRASFLGALNMERGIYEDNARMYAPYYRQASMKAYALESEERERYLSFAYADVSAAFSAYLGQANEGRPIILAGFSQGADMCYRLLEEYFQDEELYDQLVAVYAIGWPCTGERMASCPQIIPAGAADDVGVVVSFECEAPELEETFILPKQIRAHSINPLNWKVDGTPASKEENLGACFTDYGGEITNEVPAFCGGYLDERGALKVTDVAAGDYPPLVPGLPEGSFHVYDYLFFYRNLQANVQTRIRAYQALMAVDVAA